MMLPHMVLALLLSENRESFCEREVHIVVAAN